MDAPTVDGATHVEEVHTGPPDFSELAVRLVARMTEDPEPDAPEAKPIPQGVAPPKKKPQPVPAS